MPNEATADVATTTLTISGMSCGHCVANVQKALTGVDGVSNAQVSVGGATFAVDPIDRDRVTGAAAAAIEAAGYTVARTTGSTTPASAAASCCCSSGPQ